MVLPSTSLTCRPLPFSKVKVTVADALSVPCEFSALYVKVYTPACGTDHHAGIVAAIRKCDREAARAQMLSHLNEIEAELFLKDPADELRLADVLGA